MNLKYPSLGIVALVMVGCATTAPYAALSDFSQEKAEVEVAFGLFGPSAQDALEAANPVGEEHCTSLGKTATYVSARRRSTGEYTGVHIFLYRCEGADRVIVEDVEGV